MIGYYSLEAIKLYMSWSEKLLKMVKEKNRKVCSEYVFYLTNMKRDYPELRAKIDDFIKQMNRTKETIEWSETTGYTNHKHYETVDYLIKECFGGLFKHILLKNPELDKKLFPNGHK